MSILRFWLTALLGATIIILWLAFVSIFPTLVAHAETAPVHATTELVDVSKKCYPETHRWSCNKETGKCDCTKKEIN